MNDIIPVLLGFLLYPVLKFVLIALYKEAIIVLDRITEPNK